MDIAINKVKYIIAKAREFDVKVGSWEDNDNKYFGDHDASSILESRVDDPTYSEVVEYIANLNVDEKANLVALTWVGRGSFSADEYSVALDTSYSENVNKTETYLLGMPLLADYLEEGLNSLGYSVSE